MKRNIRLASSILAIGLFVGGSAVIAQTANDPHHPQGTPAVTAQASQPKQMQRGSGMGSPQTPGGGMMGQGGMMDMMANCPMMGGGASHAEGRVAFLKAELTITDAQKGVWEAYAATLKKNLQGMQDMQKTMMSMMDAKTPVERIDARIAMMDARTQSLKEIKPVLVALYAALNADQKAKADQILTGMGCMM